MLFRYYVCVYIYICGQHAASSSPLEISQQPAFKALKQLHHGHGKGIGHQDQQDQGGAHRANALRHGARSTAFFSRAGQGYIRLRFT